MVLCLAHYTQIASSNWAPLFDCWPHKICSRLLLWSVQKIVAEVKYPQPGWHRCSGGKELGAEHCSAGWDRGWACPSGDSWLAGVLQAVLPPYEEHQTVPAFSVGIDSCTVLYCTFILTLWPISSHAALLPRINLIFKRIISSHYAALMRRSLAWCLPRNDTAMKKKSSSNCFVMSKSCHQRMDFPSWNHQDWTGTDKPICTNR